MTTVYSDARLPRKGELSNNLRNFDRDRMVLFDEKSTYDGLIKDGMFPDFSNSFVVILGGDLPVKYAKYSNDRAAQYQIRTEICADGDGILQVYKYPLTESAKEHVGGMELAFRSLKERYTGGSLQINPCVLKEENGEICACFDFEEGVTLAELMDERLEKEDYEIGGLLRAPSVVPKDGRADDLILLVQHDQTVHLSRDAHALDLCFPALGKDGQNFNGGIVPIGGILLAPVGVRGRHGIADAMLCKNGSLTTQEDALAGGGTEVDANIVVHKHIHSAVMHGINHF